RYTATAADVAKGTASVFGSFRDLSGATTGGSANSIAVGVYHNSNLLFSATGASGRLLQSAGSFSISDLSVVEGDTISFVIGNNGNYAGDESALRASILFGSGELTTESPPQISSAAIKNSGETFAFNFKGELGRIYRLQYTDDLSDPDSWQMFDTNMQLKFSPTLIEQPTTGLHQFWRVMLEQ
ncbi:MAG: hypothetical protein ACSHX7_14895, partial [Luteolibacter sp.]